LESVRGQSLPNKEQRRSGRLEVAFVEGGAEERDLHRAAREQMAVERFILEKSGEQGDTCEFVGAERTGSEFLLLKPLSLFAEARNFKAFVNLG
jgi:hypothetical protein